MVTLNIQFSLSLSLSDCSLFGSSLLAAFGSPGGRGQMLETEARIEPQTNVEQR
jgi:hypothetical protein